jgi:leucine zipper transcription factor-like protein 1
MSSLGLNEHHHSAVVNYMRFARYQRGLRLKSVDGCFEDLKSSRLTEDTFTVDEVNDMLDGLLSVVRGEVDTELIHTSHTNVLLLMQLFQQAEKWHLKLQADISELENRELLEQIKDFEERQFSGVSGRDSEFKPRLQPMNESGGSALLKIEIERMNEENNRLKDRLKQVESQTLTIQKEKNQLQSELDNAKKQIGSLTNQMPDTSSADVDDMRQKMAGLRSSLDKSASQGKTQAAAMENELTSAKHELLRVREMLEMAEMELEKKVSQTAPFQNLKQILQKRNDQLKDMRRRLSKYERVDE